MKPILFPADATSFNTNGIGVITTASDGYVRRELKGDYELQMTMHISDPLYPSVQIGSIIVAKPNATDRVQPFCVEQISKAMNGQVDIYATHIGQFRTKLIPVKEFEAHTLIPTPDANEILNAIYHLTNFALVTNPFNITTDKTSAVGFTSPYVKSLRDLMGGSEGSLLDVYGGEWDFDQMDLKYLTHLGSDQGAQIVYGLNMSGFVIEDEYKWGMSPNGVVPFWYQENVGTSMGAIVRSGEYVPYDQIVPLDCTNKFKNQPTYAQLTNYATSWINKKGRPTFNVKASFKDITTLPMYRELLPRLATLKIGDTVTVIMPKYNVNYQTRIITLDYDFLREQYNSIEIGDAQSTINDAIAGATGTGEATEMIDVSSSVTGTSYSTGISLYRYGKMAFLNLSITSSCPAGDWTTIATVPDEHKPASDIAMATAQYNSANVSKLVWVLVRSNGLVRVYLNSALSSSGNTIVCTATWMV